MLKRMSTFLITLLGLTAGTGTPDPCAVRREIAPCTCRLEDPKLRRIVVACEQMPSFADVIRLLRNKFPPEQDVSLKINYSRLNDMTGRSFAELGMRISNLKLSFDNLSQLPESSFAGLAEVEYFSLADNRLLEIPRDVLRKMPKLKTLDLGRSRISSLLDDDFQDLPVLKHLLLPNNTLSKIDSNAFPRTMRRMHIGRNALKDLNGSLRSLTDLEWLFVNENQLTSLREQLPAEAPKLNLIYASHNRIPELPVELRNYPSIESVFLSYNDIASLDSILQKSRRLKILHLSHNKIRTLADDDFAEAELVEDVQLGYNYIKRLNGAFSSMKKLRNLNLTHNYLTEFSFEEEIRGLKNLKLLDLSHNKISRLVGRMENMVEVETRVEVLRLEGNDIKALGGSLSGIHGLHSLNLSNNKLMNIAPNDLIGLEDLRILDVSNNYLKTLEETSKTYLPRLQELIASNNLLESLEKDFHGLPVLCKADLSNNRITSIARELISKTRCKVEGVFGVLRIYLYNNPVLCNVDFNATADYMEGNFTILQGDASVCPLVAATTEATTTTVEPTTTTTTSTTTPPPPPQPKEEEVARGGSDETIVLPPQLIIKQAVPFPLLIAPQLSEEVAEEEKKDGGLIAEKAAARFDIIDANFDKDDDADGDRNATNANGKVLDGNILGSVVIHSPVVVKDEGSNVTLFIPVENGAIRKDHVIDQYIQKNEDIDILNQTKVPALITNIDIVEIKQLPDDPPPPPPPPAPETDENNSDDDDDDDN